MQTRWNRLASQAIVLLTLALSAQFCALADDAPQTPFRAATCQGWYPQHLQGICTNGKDAIYWSFTSVLVKTDVAGRIVSKVAVASHHGDLCFHDGKVYVATNLGKFNQREGQADNWVYIYDAESLKELARRPIPEVVHGAGGIAWRDNRFYVVGGLPTDEKQNYIYEYDDAFKFQKRHVLASGYTKMGIQTIAFAAGRWWFGCYGTPPVLLTADQSFKMGGTFHANASLGIVGLPDGRLLVAKGAHQENKGFSGQVMVATPDDKDGLRLLEPQRP